LTAITVQQPWAALIAAGAKLTENREWRPRSVIGKRIAIHAGKYKPTPKEIEVARRRARGDKDFVWSIAKRVLSEEPESWAYGRVVAVVTVGEPKSRDDAGRWHWPLNDVQVRTSSEISGRPGFFRIPTGRIRTPSSR